jgi:signal transduction histidine kinase
MGAGRVQGRHADGRELELEASISKVRVNGQLVLTAILRDVTERVAREKVLETTRSELAQLNHRLLEQEKETSRRLAQALHDELGQTLSALRLQWEAWRSTPEPARSVTMSELVCERVGQLVVTANRQIRTVMRDLRPPLLEELGLEAALDNELHQHRPLNDVPKLTLTVPPRLQGCRWPPEVEYAAYMIGREALLNALQHAQAQHVDIALDGDDLELQLRVHDDGIGIAAEVRDGRAGHLGLVGMRERARAIGAALQWDSTPGQGTTVLLRWQADGTPGAAPGAAAG